MAGCMLNAVCSCICMSCPPQATHTGSWLSCVLMMPAKNPGAHPLKHQAMVDVIDVTTKTTIKVPLDHIGTTAVTPQLLQKSASTPKTTGGDAEHARTTFTLCELYQKGKCERKDACRHVHVDADYLRAQREKHFEWMQLNAEACGRGAQAMCPWRWVLGHAHVAGSSVHQQTLPADFQS